MAKYIITDNHGSYIRQDISGKYVPVRSRALADEFEEMWKAQRILRNCIPKKLRRSFKIIEEEDDSPKRKVVEKPKETAENPNPPVGDVVYTKRMASKLAQKNAKQDIQKEESFIDHVEDWRKEFQRMGEVIIDANNRAGELNERLSEVDKEIVDIEHYIELNNLDAYNGWVAFKMLQNRLRRRRKIKDEFTILSQLGESKIDSKMFETVVKAIEGLANREYTPRALNYLFEGGGNIENKD